MARMPNNQISIKTLSEIRLPRKGLFEDSTLHIGLYLFWYITRSKVK